MKRTLDTRDSQVFDLRFRSADGTPFWGHLVATAARDTTGKKVIHTVITDFTDRKLKEEAALESEGKYQRLVSDMPVGLLVQGPQSEILMSNHMALEFLGLSEDQLLGKTSLDPDWNVIHEDGSQFPGPTHPVPQAIATRQPVRDTVMGVFRPITADRIWLAVNAVPQLNEDGEVCRVICTFVDITERKRAEDAMRAGEERYRNLFNNSDVCMFRTKLDGGEILEFNDKYLQLLGRTNDEFRHKPSLAVWLDPKRREEMVRQLLAEGQVKNYEFDLVNASGETRHCITSVKLFREVGILEGSILDLTDLKLVEEERAKLKAQLIQSQKMESLGVLAGGVAHDMNNVLGAILGLASAHIKAQTEGTPIHQSLGTICRACERGAKMVKSLLSFAHQSPAVISKIDMNAIIREHVTLLERTTLAKVRLEMNMDADLRPIMGDAGALTHAFMNLCVNAVDAMPENGTLTIHTRNVDNDWIEVVVEDNGTGMPEEVLEKAMDPFFTTKETGKGTGLGLSIVYSTVSAHRGKMAIESEPGNGTRVRLRFPACEKEARAGVPVLVQATPTPRGSMKVLLVDDDDLIRSSVQMILEVLGHTVITTTQSGEEALAMLEAGLEPDLVILDMNMPGLGGVGTLPRLRCLRPKVPVLLATGRADQAAMSLASAHPGVILLPKPFGMRELQNHIERIASR